MGNIRATRHREPQYGATKWETWELQDMGDFETVLPSRHQEGSVKPQGPADSPRTTGWVELEYDLLGKMNTMTFGQ